MQLLSNCELCLSQFKFFFFNNTATTQIYTLSLHDALPISPATGRRSTPKCAPSAMPAVPQASRSEEHTSELQSPDHLVCRLLLEKKKEEYYHIHIQTLDFAHLTPFVLLPAQPLQTPYPARV